MSNQVLKPVLVIPRGQVSSSNVKTLRDNGFIVITAKDPQSIRFLDQPRDYEAHERAAIELARKLLGERSEFRSTETIRAMFAKILIAGTSLDMLALRSEPTAAP